MKFELENVGRLNRLRMSCLHSSSIKKHFNKIKDGLKPMSYNEFVENYIINIYKYESPKSPQRRFLNRFLNYC